MRGHRPSSSRPRPRAGTIPKGSSLLGLLAKSSEDEDEDQDDQDQCSDTYVHQRLPFSISAESFSAVLDGFRHERSIDIAVVGLTELSTDVTAQKCGDNAGQTTSDGLQGHVV